MKKFSIMRRLTACALTAFLLVSNTVPAYAIQYTEDEEEEELLSDEEDDYIDDYGSEVYFDSGVYGYDHRIETYLFIGTDDSGNEEGEIGVDYRGGMADFLALLVIDHTANTFGILEIDRNTMVDMMITDISGDFAGYDILQICFSHYFGADPEGSCENSVETVRSYLGDMESIDGYYSLNMGNIGALADAVDGIEVTLEDDLTSIDPSFVPGATVLLKGEQAEAYCRARTNVGEGDNVSRMRRQRSFMKAFYDKAMLYIRRDTHFLSDLYKLMKDLAVTNISGNDVSRIAEAMRRSENKGIVGIEGETKIEISHADNQEHEAFYPEEASKIKAMTELFSMKQIVSYDEDDEESENDEQ